MIKNTREVKSGFALVLTAASNTPPITNLAAIGEFDFLWKLSLTTK